MREDRKFYHPQLPHSLDGSDKMLSHRCSPNNLLFVSALVLLTFNCSPTEAFVVPQPHSPRRHVTKLWTPQAREWRSQAKKRSVTTHHATPRPIASAVSPFLSMGVLGGIVLVHECGHYLAARWFRIEVLEFSIGMGPKLWGFRALGNEFSLRAIPVGGYVMFAGEHKEEEDEEGDIAKTASTTDPSRWLANRPWWERAIVLSGGVVFNFLLSFILYFGVIAHWNKNASLSKVARATVLYMRQLVPATASGIGGIFWGVATSAAASVGDFWVLGFRKLLSLFWKAPSLVEPLGRATSMADPLSQLSGPVQVIKAGSDVAYNQGISSLLFFAGNVSLNLGVLNAMPLPILDGGRLVFVLWEAITRRKVHPRAESTANMITTLLLLWLFFSISWKDVISLFGR